MATRFLSISRSLSLLAARPSLSRSTIFLSASPLLRLRPLAAVSSHLRLSPARSGTRSFATRQTSTSLNDPNPNWSNRPPKETILLDGCDFEHWLVVVDPPKEDVTRDDIIDSYIKTLAQVVGSEEEARMKIYSVSTKHYFAFGALVSEELSYKLKELPGVRWVLPDSYLDVKNKNYGGEPFIDGQAVPYDPKYHAEWVRNNARANERNRRNDRPKNNDRSRNFERRRENMQNQSQGFQMNQSGPNSTPNMGPPTQNPNMGPPTQNPNMGPMSPNMRPNMAPPTQNPNMGPMSPNMRPNNMGPNNMMPNNMGPNNPMQNNMRPNNMGPNNMPPNNMGSSNMTPNNMGPNNMVQNNAGRVHQNMGYQPNNMGGFNNAPNYQYRGGPNDGGPQYQNRGMRAPPQQNRDYLRNYDPNAAPVENNSYQPQNVGGRDGPPPPSYQ